MTQTNTPKLRDDMMYLYGQLQALGFLCIDGNAGAKDLFETVSEQYKDIMDNVFVILGNISKCSGHPETHIHNDSIAPPFRTGTPLY